jgi:hypothetical protein
MPSTSVLPDQHQLAQIRAHDACADLDQSREQGLGRKRQRTRREDMLVRLAVGLGRKHQNGQILRQRRTQHGEHAVGDRGVGEDRQMRSVLFDRRDRQHCDAVLRVERTEVLARQIAPEEFALVHAVRPSTPG